MVEPIRHLRFASEATIYGLWGGALLVVAAMSIWAEGRRLRRRAIDSVGWVPWTKVFFVCALGGLTLCMMALGGWTSTTSG